MADFMVWRRTACKLPKVDLPVTEDANFASFIEENHKYKIESKKAQQNQPSRPGAPSQDLMAYWGKSCRKYVTGPTQMVAGYKFETLSLMPDQWDPTSRDFIEGREDMVVNNYAQYCSVVKTGIGKAKMVIGGEVDACKWSQPHFYI